jgi:hypothetical protein
MPKPNIRVRVLPRLIAKEGAAATIALGDVETVASGQPAEIIATGTSNARVFSFKIPAGPPGPAVDISADLESVKEYADSVAAFTAGETGDPSRNIIQVVREGRINVRDLNVAGDGVVDETIALKAALERGQPLWFPDGAYRIAAAGPDAGGVSVIAAKDIDVQMHPRARIFADDLDNDMFRFSAPAGGPPSPVKIRWSGGIIDQSQQKNSIVVPSGETWSPVNPGASQTAEGLSFRMQWTDGSLVNHNGARKIEVVGTEFVSGDHWQTAGGDSHIFFGSGADESIAHRTRHRAARDLAIYCSGDTGRHRISGIEAISCFYSVAFKRSCANWELNDSYFENTICGLVTSRIVGDGCRGGTARGLRYKNAQQLVRLVSSFGANIELGYAEKMGAKDGSGTPISIYERSAVIVEGAGDNQIFGGVIRDVDPDHIAAGAAYEIMHLLADTMAVGATRNSLRHLYAASGFHGAGNEEATSSNNEFEAVYAEGGAAPHPQAAGLTPRVARRVNGYQRSLRTPMMHADGSLAAPMLAREGQPTTGLAFATNAVLIAVNNGSTPGARISSTRFSSGFGRQKFRNTRSVAGFSVSLADADHVVSIVKTGTAGAVTVNLPAAPADGQEHEVKDSSGSASTSNLVITPSSGHTINGAATYTISVDRASLRMMFNSDQSDWEVWS